MNYFEKTFDLQLENDASDNEWISNLSWEVYEMAEGRNSTIQKREAAALTLAEHLDNYLTQMKERLNLNPADLADCLLSGAIGEIDTYKVALEWIDYTIEQNYP